MYMLSTADIVACENSSLSTLTNSGGASYGAKGLKPPQILLKPPPQIFV